MSPQSRDELREKLAVAAEVAKTALRNAATKLRELPETQPRLARQIGIWAAVVIVGLGLIGIAIGQSGDSESPRGGQLQMTTPAITSTPRSPERNTSPGTGAPPNPGAPPDPGRPSENSSAHSEPQAAGAPQPAAPAQPAPPAASAAPHTPDQQAVRAEHVVARGDTLAKIALRYNVPFEQIAADSGVTDPNRIRVGQRLVIGPKPAGVEVIQPGRTLSDYARSSGRGLDELMRMNPQLTNPNRILAGGRLYV
jgi:LysM repeat protein